MLAFNGENRDKKGQTGQTMVNGENEAKRGVNGGIRGQTVVLA